MPNKELTEYIKKVRKMGHKDDHIITHLKENGYPEDVILASFSELNRKFDTLLLLLGILGAVLVLTLAAIFVINILQQDRPSACDDVAISIYDISGQTSLCRTGDNTKVMLMLESHGMTNLSRIDYEIKGEKGTQKQREESIFLKKGDVFPQIIPYDNTKTGALTGIVITPYSGNLACRDKELEIEGIRIC